MSGRIGGKGQSSSSEIPGVPRRRVGMPRKNRTPNSREKEIFAELEKFERESINRTNEEIFREIGRLDSSCSDNRSYFFNVEGIIINIGSRNRNLDLLKYAVKRLRDKLEQSQTSLLYYNIGNALLSIGDLNLGRDPKFEDLINNQEYREAKKYFNLVSDKILLPQAKTNYANILEKYGRNYEAILSYDEALKANPEFGMALGNKGIAITRYFNLAYQKDPKLILYSKELIKKALEVDSTAKIGGQAAVDHFNKYLGWLDEFINKNKISIGFRSELVPSSDYILFCKNNNIFLNYCFNCYRCEKGLLDEFAPTFISKKEDSSEDDILKHGGMPEKIYYSIKILNQIVEDYSTARYIYYQATTEDFCNLDKLSKYFSALDYCKNSIKYGYYKTSFIKLFNILDKIAHLIWRYYEPNIFKRTYFSSLLRPEYEDVVKQKGSYNLLALQNLAMDFQENGIFFHLNKVRNYLTHDYIDIKEDLFDYANKDNELNINHHLTEEIMGQYIKGLFGIVKSALIYFVNALYSEVRKTNRTIKSFQIFIPSQDYIFEKK
jgi:hypothetical protein